MSASPTVLPLHAPVLSDGGGVPAPRPTAGVRLKAVDGLRAMAMLMVYTYHVWQFGGSPELRAGGVRMGPSINQFVAGVDLFMVLSGFCLFWPLVSSPGALSRWSLRDYGRRRLRRIVPPYYAAIVYVTLLPMVLVLAYRVLGQPARWQRPPGVEQYITHLLFIHTLFPSTWGGIQGAFWSLGLEAQFYVAFPLVVFGYRRYGIRIGWAMIAVSLIYRVIATYLTRGESWTVQFLCSIFFLGRWMQFAAGMFAAWLVARHSRTGVRLGGAGATCCVIMAFLCYGIGTSEAVSRVPLLPMREMLLGVSFGSLAFVLCAGRTALNGIFENRVVVWLGFISYSVFLIHQTTAYYLGELLKKQMRVGNVGRFGLLMSVGLALVLCVSYGFFRVFEAPFLNTRKVVKSVYGV